MERQRMLLLGVGAALSVGLLTVIGAYLGVNLPDRLNGSLNESRAALDAREGELESAAFRIESLQTDRASQQETIADLTTRLREQERELGNLQSALALSGPLTEQYSQMTDELSSLKAQHTNLQREYDELLRSMEPLVAIRTPELGGDALYLDLSVGDVTYTGAVCSGSMEPNITCNDLLVLYPARVTDLAVGDIIYFRRPAPDCTAPLEGRYLLHRITEVTAGSEGLAFHTKGDALMSPDPCPVPAGDVIYKLLTNVRGGRIDG